MTDFVGRTSELQLLKKHMNKSTASFIVVRGRRRIGKSRLIEEFGKDYTFLAFSGIPPNEKTTAQSQRDVFSQQLGEKIGLSGITSDDWAGLFVLLAKETQKGKVVVLFDEISWMGSHDPDFLGKLKNAWDMGFKKNPNLMLVLCGSASAWIEKNILSNTGFVGRISYTLTLKELLLSEIKAFWKSQKHISAKEILKIASVIGGVPKYLEEIEVKQDADWNIQQLCFSAGGMLVHEYTHMFSTLLLRESEIYTEVLQSLVKGPKEVKQIAEDIGYSLSGRLSEYLTELELSGFITRDYTWSIKTGYDKKLNKYRLSDNYTRFYLKFIAKHKDKITRNDWHVKSLQSLPGWNSILGLQFENLVLNNRELIHQHIGLKAEQIIASNPFFQNKTSRQRGCQIDYMIQTQHDCLYVCEIKWSHQPIGLQVITEVEEKIQRLKRPKQFSCRPVLLYCGELSDALKQEDYFLHTIDIAALL